MSSWWLIAALVAAIVHPQCARALDLTLDRALQECRAHNPTLASTAYNQRRAQRLRDAEAARYSFRLGGRMNASLGQTPRLTLGQVMTPYSEQYLIGTTLTRTFDFGLQLSLDVQGSRTLQRTIIIPTSAMLVELGPGYGFDATLSLTQPLLRGFGTDVGLAGLRSTTFNLSLEEARAAQTERALLRDTEIGFYELYYAQEAYRLQEARLQTAQTQAEQARARESLGALAHNERLRIETSLLSAQENVALAAQQLNARRQEMTRLTGFVDPRVVGLPEASTETSTLEHAGLVAAALENAPEIQVARAQLAAIENEARIAGEDQRPNLNLQAQLAAHGLGYDNVGNAFSQFGAFAAVTGSVTLSGDLDLDTTRRDATREAALLQSDAANAQLQAAIDLVRAQTLSELENTHAAQQRLQLATQTQETARLFVQAEEAALAIGTRTTTHVVLARDELLAAELRALRARVDAWVSASRLRYLSEAP